jgi:hypothetical protein
VPQHHNAAWNDKLGAKKYSPARIVTKLAIRNTCASAWPSTGHRCARRDAELEAVVPLLGGSDR